MKINAVRFAGLMFVMILLFSITKCKPGSNNQEQANAVQSLPPNPNATDANKQMLSGVVAELNKQCPMVLDAETRWDNSFFEPESYTFQYNYTLFNKEKAELDTAQLINYISPILINNAKTNPDMKTFLATKVKLAYYYSDKMGKYLFKVVITPEQYSN